jgi:putative flippase GtrA
MVLRYGAAGALNSLLGFCVVVVCLTMLGLSPLASNGSGFLVGYLSGYALHRRFTFRSAVPHRRGLPTYLIVVAVGYVVNVLVLFLLLDRGISGLLAQALAIAAYVLVTFSMSRTFVYRMEE